MLDTVSKQVLKYLRAFPDLTWHANQGYSHPKLSFDEFTRSVEYLESRGLVSVRRVSGGMVSVSLTHTAAHRKQFGWMEFRKYVREKWIDFLALIVAILALIISIVSISLTLQERPQATPETRPVVSSTVSAASSSCPGRRP